MLGAEFSLGAECPHTHTLHQLRLDHHRSISEQMLRDHPCWRGLLFVMFLPIHSVFHGKQATISSFLRNLVLDYGFPCSISSENLYLSLQVNETMVLCSEFHLPTLGPLISLLSFHGLICSLISVSSSPFTTNTLDHPFQDPLDLILLCSLTQPSGYSAVT